MYNTLTVKSDFHPETQSFFAGKKVCVAGGSGFIGSHLVEQLLILGAEVRVLSRRANPRSLKTVKDEIELVNVDLVNFGEVVEGIKGCSVVLDLAATVGGIAYNKKHPATVFQSNLEAFFNVIKASQVNNVERFLVTSSACVYPRESNLPTSEEEGFHGEPEPTNSGYGWSKRMEEFLGRKYAEEFGLSVSIARPYNAYGPRDNFEPESSHVIPALITKAFETENGLFEVWGDGSHSRSFLHVDDFARGCIEVAARYPEADPVNLGADEETTIRTVATMIGEIVSEFRGQKVEPKFNPQGITGQPRRHCDTTKAKEKLDFRAKMPFSEGIYNMIKWYSERIFMKITLILLVRNERPCLEVMLPKIPAPSVEAGYDEIVAIDGNSTDGTHEVLKEHGIRFLVQGKRGRGEAFHTAFNSLDSDAFIFFSPDGNESIEDLTKFRPLLEGGADLVIASRMMPDSVNEEDSQMLRPRKWANNGFNWFANSFFGKDHSYITDSINGYRAITKGAAKKLELDASDYTIEYQMTMRALSKKLNVVEFPTIEGQRIAGDTGAPSIPTGLRFIRRLYTEIRLKA